MDSHNVTQLSSLHTFPDNNPDELSQSFKILEDSSQISLSIEEEHACQEPFVNKCSPLYETHRSVEKSKCELRLYNFLFNLKGWNFEFMFTC